MTQTVSYTLMYTETRNFLSLYIIFYKVIGQAEIIYCNVPIIALLSVNTDPCVRGIVGVCAKVPGSKPVTHYMDQVYR